MLLSKEQRIGAAILFGIAFIGWMIAAVWPTNESIKPEKKRFRTWEERKDSMRLADSLRYVQWAEEREQRYDSFRRADRLRREEWKRLRQLEYDSFRRADSLWRDSVGWRFSRHIKKDTILDLNHTDTAELQFIRGIGRFTAVQIIKYREQLGGFYSTVQLTDDPLATLHLDTLLAHFTADSAEVQTIDINNCSLDRLQRHPYLRYTQAKSIYELRRKRVRLRSIDELKAVPELNDTIIERLAPYLRFAE